MTDKVAIVVSGGPAPGINSVIHAATIGLIQRSMRPIGIQGGFRGLDLRGASSFLPLQIDSVSHIADEGGSLIGTSRFNPFLDAEHEKRIINTLDGAGIKKLIVIGGEGSAWVSNELRKRSIEVVHVPKTIDNDLPLPKDQPSFGYETARQVGSHIVLTLATDARTCQRWYIAETMGRQAGFLALGSGLAAGATATFIPEEFGESKVNVSDLAELMFRSIQVRAKERKYYGVILLAEGLLDCLDPQSHPRLRECPSDSLGRLTYSELELGELLIPELKKMAHEQDIPLAIKSKNIGYELRCGRPIPFDIEYTKFLGFAAAEQISNGQPGCMIARDDNEIRSFPLEELFKNGDIKPRVVDLDSDYYRVARSFMIR